MLRLRLGDDGPALGAGVGVLPEAREADDQVVRDAGAQEAADGAQEAADNDPHQARDGDPTVDHGSDLVEAGRAGNKLRLLIELA